MLIKVKRQKFLVEGIDSIARVVMGGGWRMPTGAECEELRDNTAHSWIAVNEVRGRECVRRGSPSTYIFLPAAGTMDTGSPRYVGETVECWCSDYTDRDYAWRLRSESPSYHFGPNEYGVRYIAWSVRAVIP